MLRHALSFAFLAFSAMPVAAEYAIAEIVVQPTDSGIEIVGSVVGLSDGTVQGALTIKKDDSGGVTNLAQQATIDVTRGSRNVVGRTVLSLGTDASLTVSLTVSKDGKEISTAQTTLQE